MPVHQGRDKAGAVTVKKALSPFPRLRPLGRTVRMDVIYLLITAGFFALAVALVRACDTIIGPDPDVPAEEPPDREPDTAAARSAAGAVR